MHGDGDRAGLLEPPDQLFGHIGLEQPGHVLDADGVAAQVFQATGQVDPVVQVVHRADRIGEGPLGVLAGGQGRLDGRLEVRQIVQGIEDAEDIDAVLRRTLHEGLDHVVGIVPIAQQVLTAQQHLVAGLGHGRLEPTQTLPGVFPQITDAGVEGRPTPGLQGPEADSVELLGDGEHVLDAQPRGQQGLVGVAQHQLGDAQGLGIVHRFTQSLGSGLNRPDRPISRH